LKPLWPRRADGYDTTVALTGVLLAVGPPANALGLDDSVVVFVASVLVGGGAWAVATVVLAGLTLLGVGSLDAFGVPGA
jgi:hypothetical protein